MSLCLTENSQNLAGWTTEMNNIVKKVGDYFFYGEQVIAAVSGGVDSMVMLDILLKCEKNLFIKVVHFNHSLRGDESEQDANFVKEYCKVKNIPFYMKKMDINKVAKEEKISIELAGRNKRYLFFEEFGGTIVTAHTLSDRIETMFFNIIRGCGLNGISSIKERRGRYLKPLLSFTKDEIIEYAKENNIKFCEDKTNKDNNYTRNYIRNKIIPLLYNINPSFENNIKNTMDSVGEDNLYLDKKANDIYSDLNEDGKLLIDKLNSLKSPIKNRVIIKFLEQNKVSVSKNIVDKIKNLINDNKVRESLPLNKSVAIRRGKLIIDDNVENSDFLYNLKDEKEEVLGYNFLKLFDTKKEIIEKNYKNDFIFILNYDIIKGNLVVRNKKPKDKIKLKNRPTKTLKKLCQEIGFSKSQKNEILVLSDDENVIWTSCFGADENYLADDKTKNFILIYKRKNNDGDFKR